ncbi:protein lin-54 homolog [Sitophilus oryzae]|uniref:Protein lin-54 homolog n=1 Tax=Sitophilus oryzae TaxID=7048 RepID=A0A6J2YVA5_SITOR|nr:protein lin-54 homolog [Sitophilus oryzae]
MSSSVPEVCVHDETMLDENALEDNVEMDKITELSHELTLDTAMETEEHELIVGSQQDIIEHEEEVQSEAEIEPQEIEIQSEETESFEDAPDREHKSAAVIPPLRPLNIAPKPEQVPIAFKSVSGQPLIIVPGGTNQGIKLVNHQGQEINLGNYPFGRPITIKPAKKVTAASVGSGKQMVMKKIITSSGPKTLVKSVAVDKPGQQFVVVQKGSDAPQHVKLVQTSSGNTIAATPIQSKTITLQQAQEMGLLSSAKVLHTTGSSGGAKRTVLINKNPPKTIKLVSRSSHSQISTNKSPKTISLTQIKSPAKILPAGALTGGKGAQRIIFKGGGSGQLVPAGQLIQVGTQIAGGQIHQINVPGKGMQYIKLVPASSAESPSTNASVSPVKGISNSSIVTSPVGELKPVFTTNKVVTKSIHSSPKPAQVFMVPAGYIPTNLTQLNVGPEAKVSKIALPPIKPATARPKPVEVTIPKPIAPVTPPLSESNLSPTNVSQASSSEQATGATINGIANGIRPRKPCNCTKSQCLKLYCDCFANGEFCYLCNCMNCYNNLENEDTRNMAIRSCMDRNPNAFRPKIGKAKDTTGDVLRKHTKGCNCKRSGCLKNYCECYEAKIACSSNCKCVGCRNIEDTIELKTLETSSTTQRISDQLLAQKVYRKILPYYKDAEYLLPTRSSRKPSSSRKQTISFITEDVIEATCQCLLTTSEDAYSNMQDEEQTKRQIIEEFGGCLNEIIHCSLNRSRSFERLC